MNSIDLLDKLNLPTKIGLDGESALFNKKTIMDAYLSAASNQLSRQMFSQNYMYDLSSTERAQDSLFSLNQVSADLPRQSSVDLFKAFGAGNCVDDHGDEDSETKIVLDVMNFKDNMHDLVDNRMVSNISSDNTDSNDHIDTESESHGKTDLSPKVAAKSSIKKGKKKVDKVDFNQFIADERRRLIKKLETCTEDSRIVFKKRVKNGRKNPKVSADNYRGSQFWGVSKNKSKWQVMITLNHYKEYKGGFENENEAARMYDRKSICTFGLKAKTNFDYSKIQVLEILKEDESIIL